MSVSESLFARALQSIPGGVNSPVRAFRSVGGTPFYVKSAQGATLTTADDRKLIDFVGTWGPAIHGHNHPRIKRIAMVCGRMPTRLRSRQRFGAAVTVQDHTGTSTRHGPGIGKTRRTRGWPFGRRIPGREEPSCGRGRASREPVARCGCVAALRWK